MARFEKISQGKFRQDCKARYDKVRFGTFAIGKI